MNPNLRAESGTTAPSARSDWGGGPRAPAEEGLGNTGLHGLVSALEMLEEYKNISKGKKARKNS